MLRRGFLTVAWVVLALAGALWAFRRIVPQVGGKPRLSQIATSDWSGSEAQQKAAIDFILTLRAAIELWHAHLWQMAYIPTGAFVAFTAALLAASSLWCSKLSIFNYDTQVRQMIAVVVILLGLLVWRFVGHQLRQLEIAGTYARGTSNVASAWVYMGPKPAEL